MVGKDSIATVAVTMNDASLNNVIVRGGSINTFGQFTGGIVSKLFGTSELNDVAFHGNINSTYTGTIGDGFLGGIAQHTTGNTAIHGAVFTGVIITTTNNKIGGLVGDHGGSLENCAADVAITTPGNRVGGLVALSATVSLPAFSRLEFAHRWPRWAVVWRAEHQHRDCQKICFDDHQQRESE
ncbi:MAG: hypothetical protein GY822_32230 [Deltaproteobacteria bacterium]|nr:hypothetical protein [Deltaproteobacteria bacterium]